MYDYTVVAVWFLYISLIFLIAICLLLISSDPLVILYQGGDIEKFKEITRAYEGLRRHSQNETSNWATHRVINTWKRKQLKRTIKKEAMKKMKQ